MFKPNLSICAYSVRFNHLFYQVSSTTFSPGKLWFPCLDWRTPPTWCTHWSSTGFTSVRDDSSTWIITTLWVNHVSVIYFVSPMESGGWCQVVRGVPNLYLYIHTKMIVCLYVCLSFHVFSAILKPIGNPFSTKLLFAPDNVLKQ